MKVLWLSSSDILEDGKQGNGYNGKGWISSLLDAVKEFAPEIEITVAFVHQGSRDERTSSNGCDCYPVRSRKPEGFKKLLFNWTGKPEERYDDAIKKIVNELKPDLVHIFGAETKLASGLSCIKEVPVILHLQGILNECIKNFFPEDISRRDFVSKESFFNEIVLQNGFIHLYKDFKRRARKEKKYLGSTRYAMGRTEWDKMVLGKFSKAEYFHVDEVLRPEFYANADIWKTGKHFQDKKRFFSTISEMPYKGIDTILKTAFILQLQNIDFEWNVAGVKEDSPLVRIFERKYDIYCKDVGVSFIGVQTPDGLIEKIKESDIYIHPSYIENSPNSLCEAQLAGIPSIAADTGGIPTIASGGEACLLYPNGNIALLALSIIRLISNPDDAARLGECGQKTAARRHDRKKIVSDLLAAYENAINRQPNI